MQGTQEYNMKDNVADLVKSMLRENMRENPGSTIGPKEQLKEKSNNEVNLLKQLSTLIHEKGNEIKWTGEYIAAVIGVDRTPRAELVKRANITRNHFMMMKRDMNKGHENSKNHENSKEDER